MSYVTVLTVTLMFGLSRWNDDMSDESVPLEPHPPTGYVHIVISTGSFSASPFSPDCAALPLPLHEISSVAVIKSRSDKSAAVRRNMSFLFFLNVVPFNVFSSVYIPLSA